MNLQVHVIRKITCCFVADAETTQGFESPDGGTPSGYGEIETVVRNKRTGVAEVVLTNGGKTQYPWGLETYRERIVHRTSDAHPEKTSVVGSYAIEIELGNRTLLWEAEASFNSDTENFFYQLIRRVSENGELIRTKTWQETIARDHQ